MSRNKAEEDVSVVSFISCCLGHINGIQFGLLINSTSSMNLKMRLKALASTFYFRSLIGVKEKIDKERGALSVPMRMPMIC